MSRRITTSSLAPFVRAAGALGIPGFFPLVVEPLHRRAVQPDGTVRATIHGNAMELDLTEYVQRRLFYGAYENAEARLVRRWLQPGDVMLDVGANVGYFTLLAASQVGNTGRVVAVEPVPANVRALERNVALNAFDNVDVRPVAADARSGRLSLGLCGDVEGAGARGRDATSGHYTVDGHDLRVEVDAITLDDLVAETVPNRPLRLVKVDVEGLEVRVLCGLARTLAERPPDAILVEVNPSAVHNEQADIRAVETLLRDAGYHLLRIGLGGRLSARGRSRAVAALVRVHNVFALRTAR